MQHARKMVLVPEEQFVKNEQTSLPAVEQFPLQKSVQTPGNNLARLDQEMSRILNLPVADEEKWKNFSQVLARYLFNVQKPSIVHHPSKPAESEVLPVERIIASIPPTYKNKGQQFVDFLLQDKRVTWDRKGSVSIDGKLVENSNIIDLVNDVMRSRRHFHAVGRDELAELLREAEIPREFVGNEFYTVKKPKRAVSTPITPKTLYKSFDESLNNSSLSKTLDETTILRQNNSPVQNIAPKQKQKKTPDKNNSKQKGRGWFSLNM